MVNYFFDSYAVIEVLKANPRYFAYRDMPVTITILNLIEVVAAVHLQFGKEKAEEVYEKFTSCVQEVTKEIVLEAVAFREKYKKRDISYADAVGYLSALKGGMLFLTGDKEFEHFPNVAFVKK